jgi:lipopolysaccharide biosynthesis glycosyltransferase
VSSNASPVFHSLVCERDLPTALVCLSSLLRFHPTASLILHDDGSLTDAGVERLLAIGRTSVHRAIDVLPMIRERLRAYPNCLRFRDQTCMSMKLFDAYFSCNQDALYYADSDVLFLRAMSDEIDLNQHNRDMLYMKDREQETYSVRSFDLIRGGGLHLVRGLNAGLLVVRKSVIDLDFFEWFLGKRRFHRNTHHGVGEQTA